jgi:hypothetical protein
MKDKTAKGGVVPGQVSVPMPGMNGKSQTAPATGKKVKAPAGFSGGVIPGKI